MDSLTPTPLPIVPSAPGEGRKHRQVPYYQPRSGVGDAKEVGRAD